MGNPCVKIQLAKPSWFVSSVAGLGNNSQYLLELQRKTMYENKREYSMNKF